MTPELLLRLGHEHGARAPGLPSASTQPRRGQLDKGKTRQEGHSWTRGQQEKRHSWTRGLYNLSTALQYPCSGRISRPSTTPTQASILSLAAPSQRPHQKAISTNPQ